MNTKLNREPCVNICEEVRRREAAAYYGDTPVDQYGYSHLSNSGDADGSELLVLMHPLQHIDDGNLARVVPQEVPQVGAVSAADGRNLVNYTSGGYRKGNVTAASSVYTQTQGPTSSAVASLRTAIEAVLGNTPVMAEEVERVKEARFEANGVKKFRGVTRHKRTLRFEAHIWESKKQIYLGGFESELLAARSHDIMALKCKGLDWGALNFEKSDYAEVIELLHRVQKEDIIFCLREFSKVFGEVSDASGGGSLQTQTTQATQGTYMPNTTHTTLTHGSAHSSQMHMHAKGAHALKPALKIRKHTDHGSHGHHHVHHLPGTPRTPYNSAGHAPITPKDKILSDVEIPSRPVGMLESLDAFVDALDTTTGNVENEGNISNMDDVPDLVHGSLFDPEQPVDALCEQGVLLPKSNGTRDLKDEIDPFSMFYDSFESSVALSGCEGSERCNSGRLGLEGPPATDMLDSGLENAWQWSHC